MRNPYAARPGLSELAGLLVDRSPRGLLRDSSSVSFASWAFTRSSGSGRGRHGWPATGTPARGSLTCLPASSCWTSAPHRLRPALVHESVAVRPPNPVESLERLAASVGTDPRRAQTRPDLSNAGPSSGLSLCTRTHIRAGPASGSARLLGGRVFTQPEPSCLLVKGELPADFLVFSTWGRVRSPCSWDQLNAHTVEILGLRRTGPSYGPPPGWANVAETANACRAGGHNMVDVRP